MEEKLEFFQKLKLIREEKNITLEEISAKTRIRISYLEAIEKGQFESIPSVYDKLFFQSYLETLKLDNQENYLDIFAEMRREIRGKDPSTITSVRPVTAGQDAIIKKRTIFIGLPIILAVIIIIVFIMNSEKIESTTDAAVKEVHVQEIVEKLEAKEKSIQDSLERVKRNEMRLLNVNVSFKAIDQTWLRYIKDRRDTTELLLQVNDSVAVNADSILVFLIGKADGLMFTVNDEQLGKLGDKGEIITNLTITSRGVTNKQIKSKVQDSVSDSSAISNDR